MAPLDKRSTTRQSRKPSQTNSCSTPPSSHQQSIDRLFSSSQHKHSTEEGVQTSSPNSKRRKLDSYSDYHQVSKPSSVATMYNFGSSKVGRNGVVDLTSSPNTSPNHKTRKLSVSAKVENAPLPGGPKKLPVTNIRRTPKSDSNQYCNQAISKLDEALTSIFNDEKTRLSNQELFTEVENVCKLGRAEELAKMLMARCKRYISHDMKIDLEAKYSEKYSPRLQDALDAWWLWKRQLRSVQSICLYLDRSYTRKTQYSSINDYGISLFRTHIFSNPVLHGKILDGACELVKSVRNEGLTSPDQLISAVKMFHELHVYTSDFEPRLLAISQDFIAEWSEQQCSEMELPDYVDASVTLMNTEMKRCGTLELDTSTQRDLLALLEHHIVERRQTDLTDPDAVAKLLDKNEAEAIDNLGKLFTLLERRRLGGKLQEAFSKWIDVTGTQIVFDEKEQDKMIVRLLEFKQKLDNIWRIAFNKHDNLGHTLRHTFEGFMNKSQKSESTWDTDNSKTGEMIAKYVDMLLKAGAKAIHASLKTSTSFNTKNAMKENDDDNEDVVDEDTEVDNQLDQVLDLFRFVHGKAVFEAFYKKDLARRLLMGRSASHDAEKNMLARLKTECGSGFTQNLEQMFKDIELAEEEAKAYKQRMEHRDSGKPALDLSVNILSAAAWPTYPDVPVVIPPQVKKTIDDFERFYYSKHSGRKLQWKHSLAHCQLKAEFPKSKKELIVSSFQAIVLLLFDGIPPDVHVSYEHIKTETGLPEEEVKRTLQSLACAKLRPLTKHPRGRDINDTDTFTLNSSFHHEKYRVKINAIQLKETKEENKETHVRVAADRQFETQAAIVRILKEKKTIGHSQLIAEVIEKTKNRGVLQPNDIKREIDKLIEKEYMEREEGNMYNYLA